MMPHMDFVLDRIFVLPAELMSRNIHKNEVDLEKKKLCFSQKLYFDIDVFSLEYFT